jgi:hypothetical protein
MNPKSSIAFSEFPSIRCAPLSVPQGVREPPGPQPCEPSCHHDCRRGRHVAFILGFYYPNRFGYRRTNDMTRQARANRETEAPETPSEPAGEHNIHKHGLDIAEVDGRGCPF